MSVETALLKFFEVIRTDTFIKFEKDFSERICKGISEEYLHKSREPFMVSIIEKIINCINDFSRRDDKTYFELTTKSAFIHGNKSQVEFEYYGQKAQRELGDLIFIVSIVYNGQKYFEKLTINQFKKERKGLGSLSWDLSNKEQLYLLSRFPTFTGAKQSIFPMKSYTLSNNSGCLGSYGLLHSPGDFLFISATELDSFMKHKSSLKINDLHYFSYRAERYSFPYFPYHYSEIDEMKYLMEKFHRYNKISWYRQWIPFGNYHYANNVYDFSHKYLTMGIGEPTYMKLGSDNPQAKALLLDLFSAIRSRARKERIPESSKLSKFSDSFFAHGYSTNEREGFRQENEFDFGGGAIGIIYTVFNLGE